MHSGEDKVACSRYRHNHGRTDGTPRPSSAFGLTRRKTSPSHLHTSNNKRPAVKQFKGVRESVRAVPRILPSVKQTSYWTDEQDHFTHEEDDLQQMNEVSALKEEISDLKQLLHDSYQLIKRMKVRETEIKECSTDQIFELQQKNSELQKLINQNDVKHKQELQHEELLRRLAEENLERKVATLQSKLTEAETREETIRADVDDEKTKYKKELFKLQQTSANMEPSVKQLITENDQLKTVNKHLEKVAVEMGSRFDSIKTNYNREKAELEDIKTRLQEISEDNRSKDNQVFEFRTKLEHAEKKFQEARMNDEQKIQDLETEKSKLESWYDSELSTYKQLKADLDKRVHELSKENYTLKEVSKETEKRSSENINILKNLLHKRETELEENKARFRNNDNMSTTVFKLNITNLEQENHKLKTHKELVEATNIEMKDQIILLQHKTDTEINGLRKVICELEINLKKSSLELDGYKTRHQDTEGNMASLKSQLTKALHDREETEHTLENYKRDVSTYEQTVSNLNNQLDEMSQENERLKDKLNVEKNGLNKQLHMKETEIQKMKTELANLNARYSQENREKDYLTSQLKEAQENLQQTRHRIEENGNVKNKLERDMGEINNQLSRKDTEIQKMETELANIKSRFSKEKQNMEADKADLKSKLRVTEETLLKTRQTMKENACTLENEKYKVCSKFEEDILEYRQRVSDLKTLNDTLTKENEDLRNNLVEEKEILKKQKYNRGTELQNKEREIADLNSQLRAAEETLVVTMQDKETQLAHSLARHSEEKAGMKQEIVDLKSELTALQTQFLQQEQSTAKMNTLERERENNVRELSQLREAKTSLEKQLKKLRQENENYKKDIERQRQSHEIIDGDRELLQNLLHNQKIELEEKETELNDVHRRYSEQKANTKQEIDDLKSKLTEATIQFVKEKQELENTKTSLEKQIEQLRQKNETYKKDINHQRQIHEKKDDEKTDIQRQLYHKEKELTDINRRYSEEMTSNKQEMDDLKSKMEAKVAKEKQERLNLENEKKSRGKEITQLQRNVTSLEQQIEQLRQENKKYEKDIDHQRQMYEKNGSNNADLQRQLRHKEKQLEKKETELIDIKRRYSEERSRNKHEIDDLKSKAKMTKEKQERLNFLENEMQCRGKEITQLQQTITSHEQQIEQLRQENEKCKRNIDRQKQLHEKKSLDASSELLDTKTRLQTLSDEHERKLVELSELRSRLKELEQTNKRAYEKLHLKERDSASLARESSDLDKRIKDTTAENDALRSNLKEARSRLQKEEQARKDYESSISKLQNDKQKLESCKADQEATINQMTHEINTLKKTRGTKPTVGYSDSDYDDLYRQFRRQEKQLKEVENELEDTKTRLSKCMGDQLTNNNPNIVDLSDMNRPSKLADRYKELYDNQWTDAYEILEKSVGAEEQIIKILLETLIATKRFCDHHTEMEMDHILKVITRKDRWQQSDVPIGVIKYIKDCRKSTVAETMKTKYKEYVDDLKRNQSSFVKHALRIDAYLLECFEVCWLMAIQDPPVVLAPVSKQGDTFKADLYSAYTVTGKIVDYVVWPALLLHTNGPTLTKGVAQGMKKSGSR